MRPVKGGFCAWLLTFSFFIVLGGQAFSGQENGSLNLEPGVVVEKVQQHSEAEKAGLQEGDVLLRWSRAEAHGAYGALRSPFDLSATEVEQAPRGSVQLEGLHGEGKDKGNETKTWQMGQDRWGLQLRPNFPEAVLALYREGQDLAAAGKLSEAAKKWDAIVDQRDSSNPRWLRAWLLFHLARLQAEARNWKESDLAYQEALEISQTEPEAVLQIHMAWGRTFVQRNDWQHAGEHFNQAMAAQQAQALGNDSLAMAIILDELGGLAQKQGDLSKAEGHYQQALRIREHLAPGSLSMAASLKHLGAIAEQRSKLEEAEDFAQRALAMAEKIAPHSQALAEALGNLGDVALDRSRLDEAKEYYRRSLSIYETLANGSLDVAWAFHHLGRVAWQRGDLAKAEEYYQQALAIREKLAPGSLDVAASFNSLGDVAWGRGDLTKAEGHYQQALAIREKLFPGSLDVAASFNNLGIVAWRRGDLAKAEEYHKEALAIREKLSPGSLAVALSFNNLGGVTWQRGDLAKTEGYYKEALAIREKLSPGSLDVAQSFGNLGVVAEQRGDLAKAEEYYKQALAVQEKASPGSLDVAVSFNNFGSVALQRGDLAKAEEYYKQGLAIRERLSPGSLEVAASFNNLGNVALQRGDLAKAEEYQKQALTIQEKLAPGSLVVARSFNSLGVIARERGDLVEAEKDDRQALNIQEKLAPLSMDIAWNLNRLAELLVTRGDRDQAEECYYKALAIWDKLARGSTNQVEALAGLASIRQRQGKLDEAAQFYAQALDALEKQTARLGGSDDVRAGFRASHGKYYQEYISLLMQQGDVDKAFQALERSRAQTLLEMLASSRLDIRRGADPALLKKERTLRESVAAKADRRIRLLTDKADDQHVKEVEKEISDLTNEYQEVEQQLRSRSPAYAALTQPQPLSADAVRHLLPEDDDTLLLEYSLGETHSYLFAMTANSLHSYELAKRSLIEPLARRFHQALTERGRVVARESAEQRHARIIKADVASRKAAAELSRMVLGPAVAELQNRRLLIVADRALQYVPFAALPIPGPSSTWRAQPLILEHEIVYLPSASVLALLRQGEKDRDMDQPKKEGPPRKEGSARKEVVVLADPVFDKSDSRVRSITPRPAAAGDASQRRSLLTDTTDTTDTLARSVEDANLGQRAGFRLPRLAFTGEEAKAILSVVPRGSSKQALGFDANRNLAVGGELKPYRVVHFATHALVDNIHPELSGLVLSLVDRTGKPVEGFLGLEDVYNLDLSADLVVLSACDTALGKELKGEGMIGLTRGFMYAGAQRVMATLWKVDDLATAKLVAFFYRAMEHDGLTPAQALRQAQLTMLREHSSVAPYYWAGFVLLGDWEMSAGVRPTKLRSTNVRNSSR